MMKEFGEDLDWLDNEDWSIDPFTAFDTHTAYDKDGMESMTNTTSHPDAVRQAIEEHNARMGYEHLILRDYQVLVDNHLNDYYVDEGHSISITLKDGTDLGTFWDRVDELNKHYRGD